MSSDENSVLMALLQEMQKTNASMLQEMQTMNASMQTTNASMLQEMQTTNASLLQEMQTTNAAMLQEMQKVNSASSAILEELQRPAQIVSGKYYSCITDVWDFQLKACKGNIEKDFQRKKCPDYVEAAFLQRIIADHDGVFDNKNEGNSSKATDSINFCQDSQANEFLWDDTKPKQHVFSGEKKSSYAHLLLPPSNPACQAFYENVLPCICGPLTNVPHLEQLQNEVGERDAVATLLRAVTDCHENKMPLPENFAPYYGKEMEQGTLLIIPILTIEKALEWEKDGRYSVLVVADSVRTYRWCDMDTLQNTTIASPNEVNLATTFVTDCIRFLGDSLLNHDAKRKDASESSFSSRGHVVDEIQQESFQSKLEAMKTLGELIKSCDDKVSTPTLKQGNGTVDIRLLKIELGHLPYFCIPDPISLGMKAGICLHKYAAKNNLDKYQSDNHNIKMGAYIQQQGSMMLLPIGDERENEAEASSIPDCDWKDSDTESGKSYNSLPETGSTDSSHCFAETSTSPSKPPREIYLSYIAPVEIDDENKQDK